MYRGQVCIECHLLGIQLNGFVVFQDGIWEVSCFVESIPFELLALSCTLLLESCAILGRQRSLSLRLSRGFLLLSSDLSLGFALLTCLLVLF